MENACLQKQILSGIIQSINAKGSFYMKKTVSAIIILTLIVSVLCSCTGTGTGGKPGITNSVLPGEEIMESTPDTPIVLSIADTTVAVGDSFSVFVNIDAVDWTWDSFEFVVEYDSSLIKIIEIKTTELTKDMLNLTNMDYAENKIKIAFATAEELIGGGDIVEIACEALGAGSFEMKISDQFMSREVTYKASNQKNVVEIENTRTKNGTVTIEGTKTVPLFSVDEAEVNEGDTFSVFVNLSDIKQWDSFELVVGYDTELLELAEVKTTEITANMLNMTNTDAEKGKVKLAFATADEQTVTGQVAELVFKALKSGECRITLSDPYMSVEKNGKVVDVEGVTTKDSVITIR